MAKRYRVTLDTEERATLQQMLEKGTSAARKLNHARILLKADESVDGPAWTDDAIVNALDVGASTVSRVRQRFVEEGLKAALEHRPSRGLRPRRFDGTTEAHLIALACSEPPKGHVRWTLRLLADRLVRLEYVESISHETVRQTLKKTSSSPG